MKKTLAFLRQQQTLHCDECSHASKDVDDYEPININMFAKTRHVMNAAKGIKESKIRNRVFDDFESDEFLARPENSNSGTTHCNSKPERTSLHSSRCEGVTSAIDYVITLLRPGSESNTISVHRSSDANATHYLPICDYDCNHPTICIQTGRYGAKVYRLPLVILLL